MKVEFKKRFLKELSKLQNENTEAIEDFVFDVLPNYQTLEEIGKIEKMRGYRNYFKIRFGDYRIGINIEDIFY